MRTPVISSFLPCNNMRSPSVRVLVLVRWPVLSVARSSVTHAKAAVNRDDCASDVRRVRRRDESNGCGDFMRKSEATRRDASEIDLLEILRHRGGHVGLDEA